MSIDQPSPAIEGPLKWILLLSLESLQAEVLFQRNLSRIQMRLLQHPAKDRQQTVGIVLRAFETDQDSVFVGVAAQSCPAAFHQIRQLDMVQRSAAATEYGAKKLMPTPLSDRVCAASPTDPEFCGEDSGGGDRVDHHLRSAIHGVSAGRAIKVHACSG